MSVADNGFISGQCGRIAVVMGVTEDPVLDVFVNLDELLHVNHEPAIQAAADMPVEDIPRRGAVMRDNDFVSRF